MKKSENTAPQTVKRYLKRIKSKPIDLFAGYLCKKTASVFFMAFDKDTDRFLFEINLKTTGKFLYTHKHTFENPPMFDDLFKETFQLHTKKAANEREINPHSVVARIDLAQRIILKKFVEHNIIDLEL